MIGDAKSLAARKDQTLYALSTDEDSGTIDLVVFDHDSGLPANLYLPPTLAGQLAAAITRQIQLLTEC